MKFEEIFNESGLYVGTDFAEGTCYQVENDNLYVLHYKDKDDLNPLKENALMYKNLFNKEYKKVYTRQSLFK